jgi:hypothetical protein
MRSTVKNEKESLLNHIDSLKRSGLSEFDNATIVVADKRLGRRYALGMTIQKVMSDNSINTYEVAITQFLLYNELNQLLRGYSLGITRKFKVEEYNPK